MNAAVLAFAAGVFRRDYKPIEPLPPYWPGYVAPENMSAERIGRLLASGLISRQHARRLLVLVEDD